MAKNSKSGGLNFTSAELNQLCASWMHISQDPVVGSAQKVGAFWDRTAKHYNGSRPKDREQRNVRSLETKWSKLKRDVAKFFGCYSNVVDAHHSGDNDEDTIRKAKELYVTKDSKAKEFQYVDQWSFLKDCPKFALCIGDMKQKAAHKLARKEKGKARNAGEIEPTNVEAVVDLELEAEGDNGRRQTFVQSIEVDGESYHGGEQRPKGNKTAKRLRAEENNSRIMTNIQREMVEISKKRVKIAESQERQVLFTLRVANLDPECHAYFWRCRAKELQNAMSMMDREDEEEAAARRRHSSRAPLPQDRQDILQPLDGAKSSQAILEQSFEAPISARAQDPHALDLELSFEVEMAQLDKDLA